MLLLFTSAILSAQSPSDARPPINLPTSKMLTVPSPGRIGSTNSFPATMVLSPDGRYAALLNDGYGTQETLAHQSIAVLDLKTNQIADYPDARFGDDAHQSFFIGLAFSTDGKHLYASVGSITDPTGTKPSDLGNGIAVYTFTEGKVAPERFMPIDPQPLRPGRKVAAGLEKTRPNTAIPYPAGLAVARTPQGKDWLVVAENLADTIAVLNPDTGKAIETFDVSTHDLIPSTFPYTCVVSHLAIRAWCSLWNSSQVEQIELIGAHISSTIPLLGSKDPLAPTSHPTAMLLSPNEKFLYIALSNYDMVGVVDTGTGAFLGMLTRTPREKDPVAGISPTALALSKDNHYLFVAYSAINAVAVFDVPKFFAQKGLHSDGDIGLIPTDWYPTALAVRGDDLLIATAKGEGAGPNKVMGKTAYETKHHGHPYIPTLLHGSIARLNIPDTVNRLPGLTRIAEQDNLFAGDPGTISFAAGKNPIKHVIYVLKENRTFDQILGDLKVGDADPSLTLYGEDITPNEHKLARQFGVLDNFYDSGEVSGDGHIWSTAAITSDYNEQTWQIAYRGKERTYDFQGQVGEEYPLEHNIPDVDDPGTGFLWDDLARNHLSYRFYGEFVNAVWCTGYHSDSIAQGRTPSELQAGCPRRTVEQRGTLPPNVGDPHGSSSPWPWPVPMFSSVKPSKVALRDHFDPLYPDFNTDYPDQLRADEFLNEFGAYVRARESNEDLQFQLPQFILLYLPDDHTGGTRPDRPRPASSVADNDLALGRVVDAVSHSPYWDDTAIFVLEDDAQDGADHVDAHRSTAFVVSKYSQGSAAQPYVEHRFYTTVNLIHTMEMLLGLPPMNQNDAYAPVMSQMFSGAGDQPAYTADYRNLKNGMIYETNKREAPGAKISTKMDFSRPDAAPAAQLNRVLWQDQKGSAPVPVTRHTVFPAGGD
ncbi:MAG: bifunctional YncE family protein/alkaline phosphatase family protein [Candidatus Sulfotelmatobacter sp.]